MMMDKWLDSSTRLVHSCTHVRHSNLQDKITIAKLNVQSSCERTETHEHRIHGVQRETGTLKPSQIKTQSLASVHICCPQENGEHWKGSTSDWALRGQQTRMNYHTTKQHGTAERISEHQMDTNTKTANRQIWSKAQAQKTNWSMRRRNCTFHKWKHTWPCWK